MLSWLIDFIYPVKCVLCGKSLDFFKPLYFCKSCYKSLPWIGKKSCFVCGRFLASGEEGYNTCCLCKEAPRFFDRGVSALNFVSPAKELLWQMKYQNDFGMRCLLGQLMNRNLMCLLDWAKIDYISFVPMHPLKEKERGFNQSHYFAQIVGKKLKKPVIKMLKKIKKTDVQATLSIKQRIENVSGAFVPSFCFSPADNVLLIDDVLTSGNTLNECSRVLKQNQVKNVTVFTLFSTPSCSNI